LVLGLYALGETNARRALESLGICRQAFADQLECEAGPSPSGEIPLTPRARMILGLAGVEAARAGAGEVQPEHLLLGVIRESEKWQATGRAGPHHLRVAAETVGVTLADIERNLKRTEAAMSSGEIPSQVPQDPGEPPPAARCCLRCGGERLEPGSLAARGGLSFYPANSTFWTLSPSVAIQAFLCLDCGNLELVGDVRKAESLVGRGDPK
jgi:hypothetical protein